MSKKYSNIVAYPILYLKDNNGNYVLDTNQEKIVLQDFNTVSPISDYDVIVSIEQNNFSVSEETHPILAKRKNDLIRK